ncbi:hypothetical protein LR004_01665, partial [Candidatus Gracilibacteria bacterium]|nr:hypothetical protein [Candidatus Gracilibacteria bacterium]
STNVVEPTITAITSIGIDHTKVLGNTIEEISFQKAGIIKSGIPVVYNHKNSVIQKKAEEKNAPIIFTKKLVETNLIGEYQKRNAAIAFEICKYLKINENTILEGLQKVVHWGRLQYITNNLVIDGAHNEQGLQELFKYLETLTSPHSISPIGREEAQKQNRIQLCFAQKKGKDGSKIMKVFGKKYSDYILVESENKLMVENADILREIILENPTVLTENFNPLNINILTPDEIFKLSQENKNTLYVVFGSLYMIGDFLKFVGK